MKFNFGRRYCGPLTRRYHNHTTKHAVPVPETDTAKRTPTYPSVAHPSFAETRRLFALPFDLETPFQDGRCEHVFNIGVPPPTLHSTFCVTAAS